jgi:hypothetical protein
MRSPGLLVLILIFCCPAISFTQDSISLYIVRIPDKILSELDRRMEKIELGLDRQTTKYLNRFEREENRLKKKIAKKDSLLAKVLFQDNLKQYSNKASGIIDGNSSYYSGHIDSVITALSFVEKISKSSPQGYKTVIDRYQLIEEKFNLAEAIKTKIKERQRILIEECNKLGLVKAIKKYRKEVYYYQAQVNEYKSLLKNGNILEEKIIETVLRIPAFKDFFSRHSVLASLFPFPAGNEAIGVTALQTRASLNQYITTRFGQGDDVTRAIQQNLANGISQLNQFKSKIENSLGSIGNTTTDFDIPDFNVNHQKTKNFLQRIEVGTNVQSVKARSFFPITSDVAVSLGYKVSDGKTIGIGLSGKVGWGTGWNNIRISYQGFSVRSFVDVKITGRSQILLSGGYERNFRAIVNDIPIGSLPQGGCLAEWESSGLIGLCKKIKVAPPIPGKKKAVNAEFKILWDFLSYQQRPQTQPILFRIGYNIK